MTAPARFPQIGAAPAEPYVNLDQAMSMAATVATFQSMCTVFVDTTMPKTRYYVRGADAALDPPPVFHAYFTVVRTIVSAKVIAQMTPERSNA